MVNKKGKRWLFYFDAEMPRKVEKEEILFLLRKIPEQIKMKTISEPIVVNGADYNPGETGFVIIEFSHISIHTFENTNEITIDIFSCKKFDDNEIYLYLKNLLMPTKISCKMITREV